MNLHCFKQFNDLELPPLGATQIHLGDLVWKAPFRRLNWLENRLPKNVYSCIHDFNQVDKAEHAMNNMAINFYPAPTHVKEKRYYCPPIYNAKVDERRKELSIPKFIKPHLRPLIWPNEHQNETAYSLHTRLNKVLKWFLTREGKCTHYLVHSTVNKSLVYPWKGLSQWWKKFITIHISSFD